MTNEKKDDQTCKVKLTYNTHSISKKRRLKQILCQRLCILPNKKNYRWTPTSIIEKRLGDILYKIGFVSNEEYRLKCITYNDELHTVDIKIYDSKNNHIETITFNNSYELEYSGDNFSTFLDIYRVNSNDIKTDSAKYRYSANTNSDEIKLERIKFTYNCNNDFSWNETITRKEGQLIITVDCNNIIYELTIIPEGEELKNGIFDFYSSEPREAIISIMKTANTPKDIPEIVIKIGKKLDEIVEKNGIPQYERYTLSAIKKTNNATEEAGKNTYFSIMPANTEEINTIKIAVENNGMLYELVINSEKKYNRKGIFNFTARKNAWSLVEILKKVKYPDNINEIAYEIAQKLNETVNERKIPQYETFSFKAVELSKSPTEKDIILADITATPQEVIKASCTISTTTQIIINKVPLDTLLQVQDEVTRFLTESIKLQIAAEELSRQLIHNNCTSTSNVTNKPKVLRIVNPKIKSIYP